MLQSDTLANEFNDILNAVEIFAPFQPLDPAVTFYAPLNRNLRDLLLSEHVFERASEGLYKDALGVYRTAAQNVPRFENGRLLMELASTNEFLNSAAAVTQTISLGTGAYSLSVHGPGSVTSSDNGGSATGHGTATDGSPVRIEVTAAGGILFTVAGSPTYVQVEEGRVPTSPIVTQEAAASRAQDFLRYNNSSEFWNQAEGMLLFTWIPLFSFSDYAPGTRVDSNLISLRDVSGGHPILNQFHRTDNQLILENSDGTNVSALTFTSIGLTAGIPYQLALRWGSGGKQVGMRDNGTWFWSTEGTYDGAFITEDLLRVLGRLVLPHRCSDLVIYDEDRGTAWIEANYG